MRLLEQAELVGVLLEVLGAGDRVRGDPRRGRGRPTLRSRRASAACLCEAKCASAMARTERAEESERATRKANDALARSKKMLQETMVEQLAAVRAQLDRARAQSDQLERAVGRKKAQEDRLRAETTSGERGEDAGGDGEET